MTDKERKFFENHIAWLYEQCKNSKDPTTRLIYAEKKDTACYLFEEIERLGKEQPTKQKEIKSETHTIYDFLNMNLKNVSFKDGTNKVNVALRWYCNSLYLIGGLNGNYRVKPNDIVSINERKMTPIKSPYPQDEYYFPREEFKDDNSRASEKENQ